MPTLEITNVTPTVETTFDWNLEVKEILRGPAFSPVACDTTSSSSSCTSSSS